MWSPAKKANFDDINGQVSTERSIHYIDELKSTIHNEDRDRK